jgi:arylsulfatase
LPHFHSQNYKSEARKRWNQRFGTAHKFDASMKAYYRMITEVDACAKAVVAEVERQGMLNETMIIFTTDNGFFHAEHGLSGKWFPYQESIRVPLILWDPRMPTSVRNTTNDEFTLNIDLAETILGAANLPPHPRMQGRDIADLYLPERRNNLETKPWREEFYYEFPGQASLNIIPAANALVRKDFKLFHYPEWKTWQLFNLKDDPLEEVDLIEDPKYAAVVAEMKTRYAELQASVV